MKAGWIIPFILLGGALQTCGAAMNGQLNKSLVNPWLASAVSFALITFFFVGAFLIMPHPLPATKDLSTMPWWAPIGGLVGAVQVYAGLTLVNLAPLRAALSETIISAGFTWNSILLISGAAWAGCCSLPASHSSQNSEGRDRFTFSVLAACSPGRPAR